jgi:hypothetical protein
MNLKNVLAAAAAAATLALSAGAANAVTYVFAGSWFVGQGPAYLTQPTVYSAVEAAALLFGGVASDYAISTVDSNVANINFLAHADRYGDNTFITTTVAQDYKQDLDAPGYNKTGDTSAYVRDHAPAATGLGQNFAFRVSAVVPEPATWGMMIVGFGATGLLLRRRRWLATA